MKNNVQILVSGIVVGILFVIVIGIILIANFLAPTNSRDNADTRKKAEMQKLILECGNLSPIPNNASIRLIRTEGNMFTRSFRLVFFADDNTIKKWLKDSNGIKTARLEKIANKNKYLLNTRCGFQYAEVVVDYSQRTVSIYVSNG